MKAKVVVAIGATSVVVAAGSFAWFHGKTSETHARGNAVASDGPTIASGRSGAPSPLARRYGLGARRVLHVTTEHRTEMGTAKKVGPGFTIALDGDLDVGYVEAESGGARLRGGFLAPTLKARDGEGNALDPAQLHAIEEELAHPFYFTVDERGRVRTLAVGKSASALARGLVRTVVASMQLATGEGAEWTADELDSTGEYRALYKQVSPLVVEKTKQSYLRIATARGLVPANTVATVGIEGKSKLTVDDAGWVVNVDAQEVQALEFERSMPTAKSHATVKARLVDATPDPSLLGRYALEQGDLEEVGLASIKELAASERDSDKLLVGNATLGDLVGNLKGKRPEQDGEARAHTSARLAALLRLQPGRAADAAREIERTDADTAEAMISALGAAGTEESHGALADLIASKTLKEDTRASAAMSLGLSSPSSPRALEGLTEAVRTTEGSVRDASTLALGNVARQLQSDHPDLAEGAIAMLGQRLGAAKSNAEIVVLLRALGNSGDPAVVPHAQSALSNEDPTVRMAAVTALRFVPLPVADELIAQTLASDTDFDVREEAAEATSYRALDLHLAGLSRALQKEPMASVRLEIVRVLLQKSRSTPAAMELLRRAAESDASAEVRALAASARAS
jgi:HEAT repeat protein